MRNIVRQFGGRGRAGIVTLLIATMVAMAGWRRSGCDPAAAQDDLAIQTRVQGAARVAGSRARSKSTSTTTRSLDEFDYGEQSDWIDFQPGGARVTITADRAGFNYAVFDAVYPAPAGNDYYLVITDALVIGGVFDTQPDARRRRPRPHRPGLGRPPGGERRRDGERRVVRDAAHLSRERRTMPSCRPGRTTSK